MAWWRGESDENAVDPIESFRAHLASIRDRLPSGLLALQESVSLHDGRLRQLDLSIPTATLTLRVDGYDSQGGHRRFVLNYTGVTDFRSTADPMIGLRGPHGYGHLGYDEADVTESGEFEHRILFSTGIEFRVRFTGFEVHWQDR
jgi:hypothetical protein